MRSFDYTSAESIEQAIQALDQQSDGATRLLAGGTDLLTLMKADIAAPDQLIDIKRVSELTSEIGWSDDGLTLGALTTLADIETHPIVRERYPALAEAAAIAATPQLRNMATIGGNLLQRPRCWYYRSQHFNCWLKGGTECYARDGENRNHALAGESPCVAVHPSDPATALFALDASVRLRGAAGERILPLGEFFAEPTEDRRTETTLLPDEILLNIHLPERASNTRSTFLKAMDRKVWAFALVSVAATVHIEAGRVDDARIVLGGVAPIPWRVTDAEQMLMGEKPDTALIERTAAAALAGARPLADNGYKIPLVRALVRRALISLLQDSSE
jgi:xanthine dehydrogenase YagS FAD-binding subunit